MGLFAGVRRFFGGKNMAKVTITVIEDQPAESARFRVQQAEIKGVMVIEAKVDCTLLATKYEVWIERTSDEDPLLVLVGDGRDVEPNTSYWDDCLQLPMELKAGQTVTQPWIMRNLDLARVLVREGFGGAYTATRDPRVRMEVSCFADVKGSPLSPSASVTVTLIEG